MNPIRWFQSLFAWHNVHDTGVWLYQENSITGDRRAFRSSQAYQPINQHWLDRVDGALLRGPPPNVLPPSMDDTLTKQHLRDTMAQLERNNDRPTGPVMLPKELYRMGKEAGYDMTGYLPKQMIPTGHKKTKRRKKVSRLGFPEAF